MIVAPKLLNLEILLENSTFRSLPSGEPVAFRTIDLNRCSLVHLEAPPGLTSLSLTGPLGDHVIVPRSNLSHLLAAERVVFTMQKDNDLQWISDWAQFYHTVHGATAFLIYDNSSAAYDAASLRAALQEVVPHAKVIIVRWPFLYGPSGKAEGATKAFWDSDFSQNGAFSHARWLFLGAARSVLNCDIDELVIGRGGARIFEAAERSRLGYVSIPGDWVYGLKGLTRRPDSERFRFKDFVFVERAHSLLGRLWPGRNQGCPPKWAVVPARCKPHAQWITHKIVGQRPSPLHTGRFGFRHFREINTGWKTTRSGRPEFDPKRFQFDVDLVKTFTQLGWYGSD